MKGVTGKGVFNEWFCFFLFYSRGTSATELYSQAMIEVVKMFMNEEIEELDF